MFQTAVAVAEVDFGGVWMPVHDMAEDWDRAELALTAEAADALAAFDSRRHDSALFCMPLGTPRNILTTASYPIEILQRPEQITVIFDGRGDVRRIFLDDRGHPADPVPNWMGHSIGMWEGEKLSVDTVAMTAESRLTADGLPHSEAMRIGETWRLVERGGETLLSIGLRIEDPSMYETPLTATRYFRWVPYATINDTSANCQLDQWRSYLERHGKELSMRLRGSSDDTGDASP